MPATYQPKTRGDADVKERTYSQSTQTNLSKGNATVADLLEKKGHGVVSVRPDDTIATAVGVLKDKHIGALVVTDADGSLTGILSERDIVRKLAETPGQTLPQKVSENMTTSVETCEPSELLVNVLRRMTDGRFRHMPIVEGETLSGMVTIGDVVDFRLKQLEHEALQLKQMIVG